MSLTRMGDREALHRHSTACHISVLRCVTAYDCYIQVKSLNDLRLNDRSKIARSRSIALSKYIQYTILVILCLKQQGYSFLAFSDKRFNTSLHSNEASCIYSILFMSITNLLFKTNHFCTVEKLQFILRIKQTPPTCTCTCKVLCISQKTCFSLQTLLTKI